MSAQITIIYHPNSKQIANISNTKITIITVQKNTDALRSAVACVRQGAGVVVVARRLGAGRWELAALKRVTGGEGAGIAVVADQGGPTETGAAIAAVLDGASIPVLARGVLGAVPSKITKINNTKITIITKNKKPKKTDLLTTNIVDGAGVAVVAGDG